MSVPRSLNESYSKPQLAPSSLDCDPAHSLSEWLTEPPKPMNPTLPPAFHELLLAWACWSA